ncbi:MAG TPA: hypothetical protein VFM70_04740 [Salinimicrobium sp.]|nr:hypothetical protein [Salinimicrobium sp.]
MKKLIIIICFSIHFHVHSQDYYGDYLSSSSYTAETIVGSPAAQPPEIAAFQKNNFVPVSNYTGRAEVNVPIFDFISGNIKVPIFISYNTSGVKVNEMASSVGLNWSLTAGGNISIVTKGMHDFHWPSYNGILNTMSPAGWLAYSAPPAQNDGVDGFTNPENDPQPDKYIVNAPGLSTSYIHAKTYDNYENAVRGSTPNAIELEKNGNIIEETFGVITKFHFNEYSQTWGNISIFAVSKIEITSIDGLIYTFETPEISRYHGINSWTSSDKVVSYRLDKIYDPNSGRIVNFEYEQYSNYFKDETYTLGEDYGGGVPNLAYHLNGKTYSVFPVTNRLTKISSPGIGEVEFTYSEGRLDNTDEKILASISVKNTEGIIIKKLQLEHSYFQSSIASTTPQSKRLRLDRIYEVDGNQKELPGYMFSYNNSVEMPPRGTYAHDFLGYNNGSYNSSISNPIPKYYFKNGKVSPFSDITAIELPGNFSLESNINYVKAYSLTRMTFPTGGENQYEYELNSFDGKQGGGLRIKSQKIRDNEGFEQILDYEYFNGKIVNMPEYAIYKYKGTGWETANSLSELENHLGITTFMAPQSNVEFTHNSFVGYGVVKVKDRINNGSTEYYYTQSPNMPSTKTVGTNNAVHGVSWKKLGPPGLYLDRDFMRGKLYKKEVKGSNGEKRFVTTMGYELQTETSGGLQLEYLNKTGINECYSSSSPFIYYSGYCGAYQETLYLPIARYILKSVVHYDYANGSTFEPLQIGTYYTYEENYPLIKEEVITNCYDFPDSQGLPPCPGTQTQSQATYEGEVFKRTKKYSYPTGTLNGTPQNAVEELIFKNKRSTLLKIEWVEQDIREEYLYHNYGSSQNPKIGLKQVKMIDREGDFTSGTTILKRSIRGEIEEYMDASGVKHVNLYNYNGNLIAEIQNASYNQVFSTGVQLDQTFAESSDAVQRMELDKIRQGLPYSLVTTYTYKPLVGVTSITDSKGLISYYEYDTFNRLKLVRDGDGYITQEYNYHYKGSIN